jgi:flagellar motor switch protein FliN/FliY
MVDQPSKKSVTRTMDQISSVNEKDKAEIVTGSSVVQGLNGSSNLNIVMKIPVLVKVVLGSTTMQVASLLKLGRGAVIPLDRKVGEPVEVIVNDHVVARGEVVVINDEGSRFGISLTEIIGLSDQDVGSSA